MPVSQGKEGAPFLSVQVVVLRSSSLPPYLVPRKLISPCVLLLLIFGLLLSSCLLSLFSGGLSRHLNFNTAQDISSLFGHIDRLTLRGTMQLGRWGRADRKAGDDQLYHQSDDKSSINLWREKENAETKSCLFAQHPFPASGKRCVTAHEHTLRISQNYPES